MIRTLLALLLLAIPLAAEAQTFPQRGREPVVDAAGLLNPEQNAQLTRLSEEINTATTRQFVVATIPDLQGYEIEDYGYRLLRAWGLGQKEADNGIILIVAPKERKVRIEVGYGLEGQLTDAVASRIIAENIVPRFKAGDFPGGIVAGVEAIGKQIALTPEEARAQAAAVAKAEERRGRDGNIVAGIFWLVFILVFILLHLFGRRRGRAYRRGIAPVVLWGPSAASFWGSGRGSSWGGGGGGFSGGGGSFGGGGASGGW